MASSRPSPRIELMIIAALLTAGAVALAAYRVIHYNVPLWPGDQQTVWAVGAEVRFQPVAGDDEDASAGPVKVSLALPPIAHSGASLMEERSVAPGYGFQIEQVDAGRRAIWSRRQVDADRQHLFYHLLVAGTGSPEPIPATDAQLDPGDHPVWDQGARTAVQAVVEQARNQSADRRTFVQQVLLQLRGRDGNGAEAFPVRDDHLATTAVDVLHWADVPARVAWVLPLTGERQDRELIPVVDAVVEGSWQIFDPQTADQRVQEDCMVWKRGGPSLLDLSGAEGGHVAFSVVAHRQPGSVVSRTTAMNGADSGVAFSLFHLPLHEQGLFKRLLVIPIAALVVVLMRNVVGIITSGTFLPVLLALAFLETKLIPGLALFTIIVGAGVLIRSYFSHLNLLLVARIAAALVVVIFLMMALSVTSWNMGLLSGLKVSIFPLVIIAWTIERLAVTIEEEGGWDALKEVAGTLMVAVLAFFVMDNDVVQHLAFNFPESNMIVLAAILLLGTYTGYRLTELYRFRHLPDQHAAPGDRS